jgi:hypothetical protein
MAETVTSSTTPSTEDVKDFLASLGTYLQGALDANRDTGSAGNKELAAISEYDYRELDDSWVEKAYEAMSLLHALLEVSSLASREERFVELARTAAALDPELDNWTWV